MSNCPICDHPLMLVDDVFFDEQGYHKTGSHEQEHSLLKCTVNLRSDLASANQRADKAQQYLAAEREAHAKDNAEQSRLRNSHLDLMRKIKALFGFKNWPDIQGSFNDGVISLLRDVFTARERAEQNLILKDERIVEVEQQLAAANAKVERIIKLLHKARNYAPCGQSTRDEIAAELAGGGK